MERLTIMIDNGLNEVYFENPADPEGAYTITDLTQDMTAQLDESKRRIAELEEQIRNTPIDVTADAVVEKIPDEIQRELEDLRKKQASAAALEFKLHFNNLVKCFNDLLQSLADINDDEQRGKLKGAVAALIGKMNERL